MDLHCHTVASDGALGPYALMQRAADRGVTTLAITDHDTVAAHRWLAALPNPSFPVRLISGIEVSCLWAKQEIHVVLLNFPLDHPVLAQLLHHQHGVRRQRAERIAERLEKQSITGALAGAKQVLLDARQAADPDFFAACNEVLPGRMHFAQYLLAQGQVRDVASAFRRYLGAGKPAYVPSPWPSLDEVIQWGNAMGAITVLAHPLRYRLSHTKIRMLITHFARAGGSALEVATPNLAAGHLEYLAELAHTHRLQASMGSDFHTPKNTWSDFGRCPRLPRQCVPVSLP